MVCFVFILFLLDMLDKNMQILCRNTPIVYFINKILYKTMKQITAHGGKLFDQTPFTILTLLLHAGRLFILFKFS